MSIFSLSIKHKMCFSIRKKPKCERDFESAHREIQKKISSQPDLCMVQRVKTLPVYRNKESLGNAILQRQNRLRELKSEVLEQHRLEVLKVPNANEGGPEDEVSKLDQEITTLQKKYYSYLGSVDRLADVAYGAGPNVEEFVLLRQHRDRHGRTFAWLNGREQCARFGGCCGRPCGCCERPLRTYLRPTGDEGRKEVLEVLGHCTGECTCCVRFQGFYEKHPCLPATAFPPC